MHNGVQTGDASYISLSIWFEFVVHWRFMPSSSLGIYWQHIIKAFTYINLDLLCSFIAFASVHKD